MKVRDSDMPEESIWSSFYQVDRLLDRMHINSSITTLVELGCGWGTFTLAAARRLAGNLHTYDIELEMINLTKSKAAMAGLNNIFFHHRDVLAEGFGLPNDSVDYVMLFNILHHSQPLELFDRSLPILKRGGKVGIIHWRSDIATPRGPALSIRPRPEQCLEWALQSGFILHSAPEILEPFHFGLIIEKL